jgi:serine/threonine-protein kinase RsbW
MFTDGYYEGMRQDGKRLGYEGFLARLRNAAEGDLLAELKHIEDEFEPGTDDEAAEDDRTFLGIDIRSSAPRTLPKVLHRFPVHDLPEVRSFRDSTTAWDMVERFAADLHALGWPARDARKAQLAASELTINASTHGLRDRPGGEVRCAWTISPSECRFAVDDDGPGFDPDRLPDPRSPDRLTLDHGRGIFLVRRLVAELWFDHGGSTASFVFRTAAGTSASPTQES